jgi:hypothetical protein
MYFQVKNTLKNNRYHNLKHYLNIKIKMISLTFMVKNFVKNYFSIKNH